MSEKICTVYSKETMDEAELDQIITDLGAENEITEADPILMWALRDVAEFVILNSRLEYVDYTFIEAFHVKVNDESKCEIELKMVVPEETRQDSDTSKDYLKITFILDMKCNEASIDKRCFTWDGQANIHRPALDTSVNMWTDMKRLSQWRSSKLDSKLSEIQRREDGSHEKGTICDIQ